MKRKHKTSQILRNIYIYVDFEGNEHRILPDINGVTEELIAILHKIDDDEFMNNRREEEYFRKYFPERMGKSEDEISDDCNPNLIDYSMNPEVLLYSSEETFNNSVLARLLEILPAAMARLEPQQIELIHRFYGERLTATMIATEDGVTEAAIRNRLNKIHIRIKKLLETNFASGEFENSDTLSDTIKWCKTKDTDTF